MKLLLTSVLLLAVVLEATALKDLFVKHLWNKYKESHGKVYLSEEHETYRYGVFKANMDLIEKHNSEYSMGMHTYTLGVNSFADWTVEEFREKMLGTRYNMTHQKGASAGTFVRLPPTVKAADNVDWRDLGAVTPVKNQGQCGSCWSFSTTGSLEAAHFRLTNELVSLSEQQLVDCSGKYHNEGCNGGLMDNAFSYIKDNGGLDTEESYPYHARQEKCHFNKKTIGSTCSGFIDVTSGDEQALRDAVAQAGPVSVAIDVTEGKFMLYKDGIFVDDTCSNGQDELNHGVLVVGYGTNSTTDGKNMDYWIVKNSWGEGWGEKGYIRMARNLNNMCGIATASSYPLVKADPSRH
jgi:cathepsin L